MKILFLAHRTPWPPMKGFQVRPYEMIKALKAAGHQVDLMAFAHSTEDLSGAEPLRAVCQSVHLEPTNLLGKVCHSGIALLLGKPFSLGYFFTERFKQKTRAYLATQKPDAVVVFSSSMAQFIPPEWHSRTCMDMADVDSEKWADYGRRGKWPLRWLFALEGRRMFAVEQQIARQFSCVCLAAERERVAYAKLDPTADLKNFIVITNGADIDNFTPQTRREIDLARIPQNEQSWFKDQTGPVMVFTGAMDYEPNIEAVSLYARQVMPEIRKKLANARFLIVGAKPTDAVLALAKLPGIGVTGFVDRVQPYLALADIYVVPLLMARGVQNKIIEAMACSAAIITTTAAHEGIAAQPGRDYLLADTPAEFVTQTLQLLEAPAQQVQLGLAARQFVEQNLQWKTLMDRFVAHVTKLFQHPS